MASHWLNCRTVQSILEQGQFETVINNINEVVNGASEIPFTIPPIPSQPTTNEDTSVQPTTSTYLADANSTESPLLININVTSTVFVIVNGSSLPLVNLTSTTDQISTTHKSSTTESSSSIHVPREQTTSQIVESTIVTYGQDNDNLVLEQNTSPHSIPSIIASNANTNSISIYINLFICVIVIMIH